ncbi:glycosyltransferase family 2 protein [Pararhizobium sp. LjRoot255]
MTLEACDPFVVLDADAASRLLDCPIIVEITDPDKVLGRVARICLHRQDRVPAVLIRHILLDDQGRGRFYTWAPNGFCRLTIAPGRAAAISGRRPKVKVQRISRARLAILGALRAPLTAFRALKLRLGGNVKGFEYRFARLYEALNAPSYSAWMKAQAETQLTISPGFFTRDTAPPPVFVSISGGNTVQIEATRRSLAQQSYADVREVPAEELPAIGAEFQGSAYWMRLPAGMQMGETAIAQMMRPLLDDPTLAAAYCDEDQIDAHGRRFAPFFKPAWNPPLAETGWLAPDGALIRLDALQDIPDLHGIEPGMLLIAASRHGQIVHVPRVLIQRSTARRPATPSKPKNPRTQTKVSVIIPTRDRAELLSACIEALFRTTRADDLDVIVIDNESREPETEALFASYAEDHRFRRLPLPGSFNFSKASNLGVEHARHELVLLLNNDIDPIGPGWLDQLVAELDDPRIGAAGALLLFPSGYAQHAGVTLGAGSVARHTFHFRHPDAGEDFGLMQQRQEMSAVTAACLLTRRSLWLQVGGMDEEGLVVAFNDVDYCLKLRAIGKGIMWTPHARLFHHESVSRGADDTPEKLARFAAEEKHMHERWGSALLADPFYNPNLSLTAGDHVLDAAPRDLSPRLRELQLPVRHEDEDKTEASERAGERMPRPF